MFWVNLIKLIGKQTDNAMKSLEANCTKVNKKYWIMEGDLECLKDDGVKFEFIAEGAVDALGGLSEKELKEVCDINLGVTI